MKVAIVQAAPIPIAVNDGLAKAHGLAREAIAAGAKIIVFGETFIGGYPIWLDEAPGAALWDHPGTKALHRLLLEHAICEGDARLADLQALADESGALISIGPARNAAVPASTTTNFSFGPTRHRLAIASWCQPMASGCFGHVGMVRRSPSIRLPGAMSAA